MQYIFNFCLFVWLSTLSVYGQQQNDTTLDSTFKYRSYSEMVNVMYELRDKYPSYVKIEVAQEKYKLGYPDALKCNHNGRSVHCKQIILHITDHKSLSSSRPEVFFSGALHGNERVGPQVVLELAKFLLKHTTDDSNSNQWIRQLIGSRSIFLMPMTNAWGYDKNRREENGVDPNRDYNYLVSGRHCMQAMTTRSVNELWREHIFQLAITFHGGTRGLSYEWGSPNHLKSDKSPDDRSQWYLALGMSYYGGRFQNDKKIYPFGTTNDLIYPVKGGMEDWAYAASWENDVTPSSAEKPISPCKPTSYGGYDEKKTIYNKASHRAFNILIETSYSKNPRESSLGNSNSLSNEKLINYLGDAETVGHVPRNIRIALMYIDIVEPYVNWKQYKTLVKVGQKLSLKWEVMGAFTIDKTYVKVAGSNGSFTTKEQTGVTKWYHEKHQSKASQKRITDNKGQNKYFGELVSFDKPGEYRVHVVAVVDQDWKKQGSGVNQPSPNVPPQSHIVNARTNPHWKYENNGHVVKGRLQWKSSIILVKVV